MSAAVSEALPFVSAALGAGVKTNVVAEAGLVREWIKSRRFLALAGAAVESGSAATYALFLFAPTAAAAAAAAAAKTAPSAAANPTTTAATTGVALEQVLPIDGDLKCDIDSCKDGPDVVYIKLSSPTCKLLFEMVPGYHTQNFVSEIFRLNENASKSRAAAPPDFSWLQRYKGAKTALAAAHPASGVGGSDSAAAAAAASAAALSSGMDGLSLSATALARTGAAAALSISPSSSSAGLSVSVGVDGRDTGSSGDFRAAANSLGAADAGLVSPDMEINRQDIAMGVTPIAARESVVKYQMSLREDQFTTVSDFTIFCGTWNVNGQSPTDAPNGGADLERWLAPDEQTPDLYAVAFQELDLSKESFIFTESVKEDEWKKVVTLSLHPDAKYKQVRLVRLVGMMLIVFVKAEHSSAISDVCVDTVGTGIMGKLGNKGGVSVRLDFHNTSVCFVCSHFAAHMTEVDRRNQDFNEICARTVFTQGTGGGFPITNKYIKDHDMVFWLGDLNYRIDHELDEVKELCCDSRFADLLDFDQLMQQRQARKVFNQYAEGELTFPPTYKYDVGTDDWDTSEKARAPAWCDRVLWKGQRISQLRYSSHMELLISDHKPVSAVFRAGMKVIDNNKYRVIYEEVMKKLDKLENEFLPQVTVETNEIAFGTVRFIETSTKSLAVANTGQVPVQFKFIKKLNEESHCKPWLSVEPSEGFIMPGEKCDINIEIYIDKKSAGPLTSGLDQLYDILVLHLFGGRDIFVTVAGEYQRSCFGASIAALVRLAQPISELSAGRLAELERTQDQADGAASSGPLSPDAVEATEAYPVPKELWFLCDLITSLGLDQEHLFLQPGMKSEMLLIRDWLDTGLPVTKPDVSIHTAAESLLMFLESLREPIVPFALYPRCLECAANYLQCQQLVSQLPTHHKHVFVYIGAFLREVIRHSARNGIDPKILATLFASIVLRDPPGTNLGSGIKARTNQHLLDQKKARFLYHFLVNEPED